jgi:hypothetical protein
MKNKSTSNFHKILNSDFKWKTHLDDSIYIINCSTPEIYYHKKRDYNYCKKNIKKLRKKIQ